MNSVPFGDSVSIYRVIRINVIHPIKFPCQQTLKAIREGREPSNADKDDLPSLEDQDAKPVREPEPSLMEIERGEIAQSSLANAVHHRWLPFLRKAGAKEGW